MLDMLDYVGYSFVIALGTVALFKTSTVHNKEGERYECSEKTNELSNTAS